MSAGRFLLVGAALAPDAEIELPLEVAHQTRDVLRLTPGDSLRLLDGVGGEYPAELIVVERKRVVVRLGGREVGRAEPTVRIVLCQGMLKGAKFEWVLQKGTELGVAAFVPLLCERAVAATEVAGASKWRRWEKILTEAVEQCGGTRLPELTAPRPLPDLLADCPPGVVMLVPWEEETATPLRTALDAAVSALGSLDALAEVRLFIGPEGGFAAAEVALARRHGARPVTLGRRTLRAETAALVAVALTLDTLRA
ncbi:MAG: 16S rRNA (uracil(1498)-N(3))-methyltransferase [Ktedonobacterales bacterium]|nr:16S rRNA (uracil(1498)-N(3))-methyltransferase [Ktedonobacterales bacterium]